MSGIYFQGVYGDLINWREDKINDTHHKHKVISGYAKIGRFLERGVNNVTKQQENK